MFVLCSIICTNLRIIGKKHCEVGSSQIVFLLELRKSVVESVLTFFLTQFGFGSLTPAETHALDKELKPLLSLFSVSKGHIHPKGSKCC